MDPLIDFRTLGGVDLTAADGRDLTPLLRQPKRVAVLAYLVIAGRGGFVRRDKLQALFWPEADAERARSSLRTSLHRLRMLLGGDAIVTRGQDDVRAGDGVIACDANLLRDASDAGDYDAAFARFTGELLDGMFVPGVAPEFEQWLDRERNELRRLAIRAGWEIVARVERGGDVAAAAGVARHVMRLDAADEVGMRRLLALLIAAGDRSGAAAGYEEFRRTVEGELGIEPSPETRAMVDSLRIRVRTPTSGAEAEAHVRSAPATRTSTKVPARYRAPALWLAVGAILLLFMTLSPLGSRRGAPAVEVSTSHWRVLDAPGATPFPRWHPIVVLDSTSRNVLLFGGRESATNLSDLWRGRLDSSSIVWTRIRARTADDGPGGQWIAAAAYNARTDRMILFGGSTGYSAPCSDELWILDHVSGVGGAPGWTKVPRSRPWPSPRADHRVAHDPSSNRVMLFGGHDCVAPTFRDYWVLKNADGTTGSPTWQELHPDTSEGSPRGPRGLAWGYNPSSNRVVVFGGYDHSTHSFFNDAWVLSNANGMGGRPAWHRLEVRGERPAARINMAYGYDAAMNRLVVAQGDSSGPINDAWVLVGADGTTPQSRWQKLPVSRPMPDPQNGLAAAFDVAGGRLFVFSGTEKRGTSANWVLLGPTGR